MIQLQAHKGVEAEYPENTMASFRAAVEQGYTWIELDLAVTADHRIVVLHNNTVNHTGRNADGSEIAEETPIASLSFEEARKLDFGIWKSPEFRGEKIPEFREVLELVEGAGVGLKLDNKIRRFPAEDLDQLFAMLADVASPIMISCWDLEIAHRVRRELPGAYVSFDGITDEAFLQELSTFVPKDQGYIWLPVDGETNRWAPREWFATDEKVERVKKYFRLGLWSVYSVELFRQCAPKWQPDIVETTGIIKPGMEI